MENNRQEIDLNFLNEQGELLPLDILQKHHQNKTQKSSLYKLQSSNTNERFSKIRK